MVFYQQTAVAIQINGELLEEIDAQLARLKNPTTAPLHSGLRYAGNIVKRRTYESLPKPGYPGDRPVHGPKGLKPLRDTLTVEIAEYDRGGSAFTLAMVGYAWGAGSHGHNVEYGHRIATKTTGKLERNSHWVAYRNKRFAKAGVVVGRYDLEKASLSTLQQQKTAIIEGIKNSITKTLGRNPTEGA